MIRGSRIDVHAPRALADTSRLLGHEVAGGFVARQATANRRSLLQIGSLMPTVLLVRHGQASFGAEDYDILSDLGVRQAATTHSEIVLRDATAVRLISGTLRRQRDTARPWIERGPDLEVDPRWNEYHSSEVTSAHGQAPASPERPLGADGQILDKREFQILLDAALLAWISAGHDSATPEPWPIFRERCCAALSALVSGLGSGETAIAFTSGGVIATLVADLLGLPEAAMVSFNRVLVNSSITKVVGGRRGMTLVSFNEHGHLEPDRLVTYR